MAYINGKQVYTGCMNGIKLLFPVNISLFTAYVERNGDILFSSRLAGKLVNALIVNPISGQLPIGEVAFIGKPIAANAIATDGTLEMAVQLLGDAQIRESAASSGAITFAFGVSGKVSESGHEHKPDGLIGFAFGVSGTGYSGNGHSTKGELPFGIGVFGEANAGEGITSNGNVVFLVSLQGKGTACVGVNREGVLLFDFVGLAEPNMAERIIQAISDTIFGYQMTAFADTTAGTSVMGSLASAITFENTVTVDSYTVTDDGGLIYDINASAYEYTDGILTVWG